MFRPHQSDELRIGQSLLVIYSPNGGRCAKYVELSPSLSLIPHATGMLALHEHHHICLKKQCESALGAGPRNFYHFVFAIGHYNARHTAMEIALAGKS